MNQLFRTKRVIKDFYSLYFWNINDEWIIAWMNKNYWRMSHSTTNKEMDRVFSINKVAICKSVSECQLWWSKHWMMFPYDTDTGITLFRNTPREDAHNASQK
jgi:hypothetical protein